MRTDIKTLYIDFDGTLVNTIESIVDLYNEDFKYYKNFNYIRWCDIDTWGFEECKGKCCPDAIANALIDMYKEMKNSIFSDDIETSNVKSKVIKKNTEDKEQSVNVKNPCPVCGEELTFEGGCNVCKACGWSKCD